MERIKNPDIHQAAFPNEFAHAIDVANVFFCLDKTKAAPKSSRAKILWFQNKVSFTADKARRARFSNRPIRPVKSAIHCRAPLAKGVRMVEYETCHHPTASIDVTPYFIDDNCRHTVRKFECAIELRADHKLSTLIDISPPALHCNARASLTKWAGHGSISAIVCLLKCGPSVRTDIAPSATEFHSGQPL